MYIPALVLVVVIVVAIVAYVVYTQYYAKKKTAPVMSGITPAPAPPSPSPTCAFGCVPPPPPKPPVPVPVPPTPLPVPMPPPPPPPSAAVVPLNTRVQIQRADVPSGMPTSIAAMWDKPRISGTMNNQTPLRAFVGTFDKCAYTNCAFKIVPNPDGSVSIQAADDSGVLAMWGKRIGTNASASMGLFMFNGTFDKCAADGCSFKIEPSSPGAADFVISAADGTGYVAVDTYVNGSAMSMTSNRQMATRFVFPAAPAETAPASSPAQKCPFTCQAWNSASGSCVGAASNVCSPAMLAPALFEEEEEEF